MIPTQPLFSEEEFWRDFHIIRNDVNAAMVSCYTHRTINDAASADPKLIQRLNRVPDFWRITTFSLQTTLFIVLHRILDSDGEVHSIHQVLRAMSSHPELFSKDSLRARKLSIPGVERNPPWLEEFILNAWEPTIADFREMKKALKPHKMKFDDLYRPIRHHIAHITHKEDQAIAALYARTLKTDIDEILCFLHNLMMAIQDLAWNATRPNLTDDNHGYARRVMEIRDGTTALLHSL